MRPALEALLQHAPRRSTWRRVLRPLLLLLQEAYELVMGKRQGKEVPGRPGSRGQDWEFHDW